MRLTIKKQNYLALLHSTSNSKATSTKPNLRESVAAWNREGVEVTDIYQKLKILGHGHMGEVYLVKKRNDFKGILSGSNRQKGERNKNDAIINDSPDKECTDARLFACKTVSTVRMKRGHRKELMNEIDVMRSLDHPYILQLFEVYSTKRKIWLVTELCSGGDLTSRDLTEPQAVVVLEQITLAVAYMHSMGVCHRDIKLENILYENQGHNAKIKLVDFGLSQKFTTGTKMRRACGTAYTVAPELVNGRFSGYTEKTDIWSIGIVAYILLGKEFPFLMTFDDLNDPAKKEKLIGAKYVYGPPWNQNVISREAKEFVHGCLRKHPGVRWNAPEATNFLKNTWAYSLILREAGNSNEVCNVLLGSPSSINANDKSLAINPMPPKSLESLERILKVQTKMEPRTVEGMKKFITYGMMRKTILMTLAYTLDKGSLIMLRDLFLDIDFNHEGTISLSEFRTALRKCDPDDTNGLTEDLISDIFNGVDQDNSGRIQYAEFLAAVAESQGLITMERLADAFDRIDSEGKGHISKNDLRTILGSDFNDEVVNEMIDEADYKKNGQIDYDEFLRLMFNDSAISSSI